MSALASDLPAPRAGAHRLLALDGLRGLAALMVVVYHYLWNVAQVYPQLGASVEAVHFGGQGVRVFFVISGIVIFMSLQNSTPAGFIRSRFIRLYPTYWVAVAITATAVAVFGLPGRQTVPLDTVLNLSMVQDFFGVPNVDGAYWTLAVELAFYVMAAVLWFTGRLNPARLPVTLYLWLASMLLIALAIPDTFNEQTRLFENIPWFLLGISALAIINGDRRPSMLLFPLVAVIGGGLFNAMDAVAAAVAFAIALVTLMWRPLGLASRPLRFLGWLSFPLYLLHQNLGYILLLRLDALDVPRPLSVAITLVLAVTLAALFTRYIDEPLRRLIGRHWRKPATRQAPGAAATATASRTARP
jgi:peptidoglycan/LPS O-acetylase OafA/YrhL